MIATGTGIALAAGIGALGGVAKGVIDSKSSKHATDAQMKANDDALTYQKQKDATGKSEYDASVADYKQRYADWVSQFYGGGSKAPLTSTTVAPNPASGAPMSGAAPANLGVGAMTTVGQAGNNNKTDPNGWQDWARYMPKPGLGA